MVDKIRNTSTLGNALRDAVNKKIDGSGFVLYHLDEDGSYATSDIIDKDNCSCGQLFIDEEDTGLTCNISEWLTAPKFDDCYNTRYFGAQYDPISDRQIPLDWNCKKEFESAVNAIADFIKKMPTE